MKRKILLALLVILFVVSLISCGNGTEKDVEANYKVTVLNTDGTPMDEAIVYFGEEKVFADENGVATITLVGRKFAIRVLDYDKKEYFIGENVVVTPSNNEIIVKVLESANNLPYERIHDSGTPNDISDDRKAYLVSRDGTYYTMNISSEELTFFLFTPIKDGIYEFSIDIEGEVGYYGAPLNALHHPIEPLADENGVVTIEIKNKNLGSEDKQATPYLIGFKAKNETDKSCTFKIHRASDPVYTDADQPYTYITNPSKLSSFFISYKNWDIVTTNIDITKSDITLAYNENDKCYHYGSKDGPVVYVRVGSASPYLPGLYTVCETSLMSAYIYDEEGNFVSKEAYNGLVNQYYGLCDKGTGLYPLDKYMERAIKNHGNAAGWWNDKSPMYLFGDTNVNADNAWLFACCTVEIKKDALGKEDTPIEVEKSTSKEIVTEKAYMNANSTLYFDYISGMDATLTVNVAEGIKVIYNGTEYVSQNGQIIVSLTGDQNIFQIVSESQEDKEVSFTIK